MRFNLFTFSLIAASAIVWDATALAISQKPPAHQFENLLLAEVATYLNDLPLQKQGQLGNFLTQALVKGLDRDDVSLAQTETETQVLSDEDLDIISRFLLKLPEDDIQLIADIVRGDELPSLPKLGTISLKPVE